MGDAAVIVAVAEEIKTFVFETTYFAFILSVLGMNWV